MQNFIFPVNITICETLITYMTLAISITRSLSTAHTIPTLLSKCTIITTYLKKNMFPYEYSSVCSINTLMRKFVRTIR